MTTRITHRGPDADGTWFDEDAGSYLGHRRLSILDLSPAGAQPMHSKDGRYVIVFNGEIYNFAELRRELEQHGRQFVGHSDTEVLVEGVSEWGVRGTLERTNGMFALAVWDKSARELYLARDRMGEKPLYYGIYDNSLLFASELKSFQAWPGFKPDINRDALCLYLRCGYVPDPFCIFRGFRKLRAGHFVKISHANMGASIEEPYWSLADAVVRGKGDKKLQSSPAQAVEELDACLGEAVALRMVADVPLGAFLSGGIDSSAIVALMQAQSTQPVRTFSIGFDLPEFDESAYAAQVARHLGTAHTELIVTSAEAREVIPLLADIYDEPFADSSQIPTYLVSKLARSGVTVAMSGDAGDELFGGYSRYTQALDAWRRVDKIPAFAQRGIVAGIASLSSATWDRVLMPLRPLMPDQYRFKNPGEKLYKFSRIMQNRLPSTMYKQLVSLWTDPAEIVMGGAEPKTEWDFLDSSPPQQFAEKMMYTDSLHYLPGDILVKVDRASMAVSLESRVPFLDHKVVEFAWSLPYEYKIRDGTGKWILREVLAKYVPRRLFERPKMGFGVPIGEWLRGPLKDWAENLLGEQRLTGAGYFNPGPIRAAWQAHLGGAPGLHYALWNILIFEQWRERWGY